MKRVILLLFIILTSLLMYVIIANTISTPVNTNTNTVKQSEKEVDQKENNTSNTAEIKTTDEMQNSKAPVIEKSQPKTETIIESKIDNKGCGQIFIECIPLAKVFVDSKEIETTSLKDYIMLPVGEHIVTLMHPDFPKYTFISTISKNKKEHIKVNLRSVFGYLNLTIYPWGVVYMDDRLIGSTPFQIPFILEPGKYKISVRNPHYQTFISEAVVSAGNITEFKYNFKAQNDSGQVN